MTVRDPLIDDDSDPGKYARLDSLAAEFAARYRRGERPSLKEYTDRHPELADEIRDVFPAMVGLERAEALREDLGALQPAEDPPALSQVGDFRILRQIGRGGMGIVYEAEQVSLGRRVALKVLPGGPLREARSLERFRNEARAAARLHHTNIVSVFEVGQDGDILYFTMQFIQGQGLDLVIEELKRLRLHGHPAGAGLSGSGARSIGQVAQSLLSGQIGLDAVDDSRRTRAGGSLHHIDTVRDAVSVPVGLAGEPGWPSASAVMPGGAPISAIESLGSRQPYYRAVAQIGRQVADALAYAHTRGVVHRDIKPSNLLLDSSGVVWVTDFGLAKADDSGLTATGDLLGTLRYMAPERFRGEGDARGDVYALGLTLHELLTLRPAFESPDRLRLIDQIKTEDPPRPRAVDPRIPRDLEILVLKAIEKDPRRRYQSAADLADDLRRFLDGEPIRARRVSELERAWKWAMRHKAIAGLLIFGVVSAVVGMAASLGFSLQVRHYAALADARARDASASALEARRVAADARAASAVAAAEAGEGERGVYGLVEALEMAPAVTLEDHARKSALRRNLAAWMSAQVVLRHAISGLDRETHIVFIGPDRTVVALITGRRLRRFDLVTGLPVGSSEGVEFPAPIIAVSPDGSLVVTAARIPGRPAAVWDVRAVDAASGRERLRLPPEEYDAINTEVVFDPNGRYLGLKGPAAEPDRFESPFIRRVWRLDTNPPAPAGPPGGVLDHYGPTQVRMIADRSGHTVLVHPERLPGRTPDFSDRLLFWDLDSGHPVDRLEPARGAAPERCGLDLSHYIESTFDGTHLIYIQSGGQVRWYDVATGQPARPDWRPHRAAAYTPAALAGDGRTLAVRCDDNRVRFYDLASRRECGPAPILRGSHVNICPQGSFLLARRGGILLVWQLVTAPRPAHPSSFDSRVPFFIAMAAPPDGEEYAIGDARAEGSTMGRDTIRGLIKVPDTRPVGHRLRTANGQPLGAPLYPLANHPCYSPDGRLFAACRTQFRVNKVFRPVEVAAWDRATGGNVLPWTTIPDWIHGLAFSPDGRTLAVGIVQGVWLVDLESRRPKRFLAQPGPIVLMRFSPDGRRLAAGTRSGWGPQPGARLWDVASGKPVGDAFPTGQLPSFQFTPDGEALVILDPVRRRLARIDTRGGRPIAPPVPLSGQGSELSEADVPERSPRSLAIAFRPDGAVIAESPTSITARQYDVHSGLPVGRVMSHGDTIGWLAYSPDGQTLASACPDGTVRLWDAPTGRSLGPALVHGLPPLGLFFSADGATVSVVTIDGRATLWPVPRPVAAEDPRLLRLWIEVVTGQAATEDGEVLDLAPDDWRDRRERLARLWPQAVPSPDGSGLLTQWHRDRAEDARRVGDALAYGYHLDRLVERYPTDWLPAARVGADLIDQGRTAEAQAAYDSAARLAPAGELTDWYWSRACEHLASQQPDMAAWYLDKIVKSRPDDWRVHAHRAEVLDRLERSDEAAAERDLAVSTGADAGYLADEAGRRAAQGEWQAAVRLSTIAETRGDPGHSDRALLFLVVGDRVGYLRACKATLAAIATQPANFDAALEEAWTVGLAPNAVSDYARPLKLAASALAAIETWKIPEDKRLELRRQILRVSIALLIRAGRPAEALSQLASADLRDDPDHRNDLLAAIAHAQAGHIDKAQTCLSRQRTSISGAPAATLPWQSKAELMVLQAEAVAAVYDRSFPANPFAAP